MVNVTKMSRPFNASASDLPWSTARGFFARSAKTKLNGGIYTPTSDEVLISMRAARLNTDANAYFTDAENKVDYECAIQQCWKLLNGKQRAVSPQV